jgi:signal transduction histidine kinase
LIFTLFFNLINNAIKYNVPNGKIEIASASKNGKFSVEIKDTGIGMDTEKIKTLFDRFRNRKNLDEESHGLGLPIVKAIADFHKIDIHVSSQPNIGSTFSLIFP